MADRIRVFDSNMKALGSTSKAFSIEKSKELMREYTLSFAVVNNDSIFRHLKEDTVFEYGGQKFDIAGIDGESGASNITRVAAEHISYRLADYTLPNGYSFVGTVKEIAEDILAEAKTVDEIPASTEFSIGDTADLGTLSFSMSGATNVTAREALVAMSELGVEIDFDNFTVHLPQRIGKNNGLEFRYSVNLSGVRRTWQKGNGWSYDISIADLQKKKGGEQFAFEVGDDVTVYDTYAGEILKKRIIGYTECDDPTQNRITIGVFIRDNASLSIETDRIANAANNTANNSVQQGEKYSNVSITHKNGFVAETRAGTQRVVMNSDDCFAVQEKQGDEWVTINSLEHFGILIDRLTSLAAKDMFYIKVGKIDTHNYGLKFFCDDVESFEMGTNTSGTFLLRTENNISIKSRRADAANDDSVIELDVANLILQADNILKKLPDGSASACYTGTCRVYGKEYDMMKTMTIQNGLIMSVWSDMYES